jgi:hypothetical protein
MYVFNKWLCSSSFWKLLLVCCSAFLFFDSVRGFFGKQQLDCIPKEPFIVELLCASASAKKICQKKLLLLFASTAQIRPPVMVAN